MVRAATQQQVRKQILRMGRSIQMVLKTEVEDTSRGQGWVDADEMPAEVHAITDYGGDSLGYDLFGASADASLVLYLRDDVADAFPEVLRDKETGGDQGATHFVVDSTEFRVTGLNRYEQYGAVVCECEEA